MARARLSTLTALLQPIGLHRQRAARCIKLGLVWRKNPPNREQRYVRKGYAVQNLQELEEREKPGWEIAHLPGVGPYALDSFRIFHRDKLRGLPKDKETGLSGNGLFEPEWKRVLPDDKDLRAYLKWRWMKDGYLWNEKSGSRTKITEHGSYDAGEKEVDV